MNKTIEKQDVDKKLPKKYIFLLYIICLISGAISYEIVQKLIKAGTKKDYLNIDTIPFLIFLVIYFMFIFFIKKKSNINKLIQINTIYLSFLLTLNFIAFIYLYRMGFQCSIFLHNYEAFNLCHEKLKIYHSLFPFHYNILIVFIMSFTSIVFVFLRNNSIAKYYTQLSTLKIFLWLLFLTEIPLILKYIFNFANAG